MYCIVTLNAPPGFPLTASLLNVTAIPHPTNTLRAHPHTHSRPPTHARTLVQYHVTGLTPERVFAFSGASEVTGADLYDAVTIRCTNGATVTVSGVGNMPGSAKIVHNTIFGTEGMLTYSGYAYGDNAGPDAQEALAADGGDGEGSGGSGSGSDEAGTTTATSSSSSSSSSSGGGGGGGGSGGASSSGAPRLHLQRFDGTEEEGPAFDFEFLDPNCPGPGSLLALVDACHGRPFYVGSGAAEGLKAVQTIEAMYASIHSGAAEPVKTGL